MSSNLYALARIPIIQRPQGYYLRWYYNGWHYWQFFGAALGYTTDGEKYRTTGTRNVAVNSGQLTQVQVEGLRTILNTTEVYLLTDKGWMVVRLEQGTAKVYDNQFSGYEMQITIIVGSRLPSMATGYSPVVPPVIVPAGSLCETIIGTQVWLCKNWDAAYPSSKVYDNDEANRAKFGGLYTYDQVNSAGFVPEGWDFPTIEQWRTLIAFVGGAAIAGGKLKQAGLTNWVSPNVGADNAFGFDGLAAGYFGIVINEDWTYRADFANLQRFGYFWAKSPEGLHMCFLLSFDTGEVIELPYVPAPDPAFQPYHSVRFIKSTPSIFYPVIYGSNYNWYVIEDARNICANGAHIPTDAEWTALDNYLAANGYNYDGTTSGNKYAKSLATANLWGASSVLGAVGNTDYPTYMNKSSFNGRPSGYRDYTGSFVLRFQHGVFWSATDYMGTSAWHRNLIYTHADLARFYVNKKTGVSLRVVKDSTTLSNGQMGIYTGNDGKVYKTICINSVEYLADNLAETKYRNGDAIPEITDSIAWAALTTGARCWYNNIPE